jgi:D-beta-D-heptose 7-phosphate kinase/D-beta-D-heptose 1-phosphate adenosyltransferase
MSLFNFLVIGEVCTDEFIYGKSNRLSPEAPVPIFEPVRRETNDGMAKNTYNNLLALIRNAKRNHSIDGVFSENMSTKTRYVDIKTNHYFLRVDSETDFQRIVFDSLTKRKIQDADCIVISDYNKGYLELEDIIKIYKLKKESAPIFLDTKKQLTPKIFDWIDFIKVNQKEYNENVTVTAKKIHSSKIIVTLGETGAFYNHKTFRSTNPKNTVDVSGAGDTFMAALCFKYMESKTIETAIQYANLIAGEVVSKRGVSTI